MIQPVQLLLAHGSRDPEWRRPFETMAEALQRAHPERRVYLCYLELWTPSLAEAVTMAYAEGQRRFRITPLFWSRGRHLREDLPEIVDGVLRELPGCEIVIDPPVGESDIVQAAVLRLLS